MSTLFLLIIISVFVAALFVGALVWGIRNYKARASREPGRWIFFDDEFQREIYS